MGYRKNPFGSGEGIKIVEEIFDLMFLTDAEQPSKLEITNKGKQVKFYKDNIVNIVNKMRKFVTGYQQVPINETSSSGIHICPHCNRRDFIYFWQVVDGGHYDNPAHWNDSVQLGAWKKGTKDEKGRYCFALRYRCNNVTTCNSCHLTVNDPSHSITSCRNCGESSKMAQVGCGEESYGLSFIKEYKLADYFPTSFAAKAGISQRNSQIVLTREKIVQGKITGYELVASPLPPAGEIITTFQQIEQYTPHVTITYSDNGSLTNTNILEKKIRKEFDRESPALSEDEFEQYKKERITRYRQKKNNYPLSDMKYALTKQNQRRCKRGLFEGGKYRHQGRPYVLKTGVATPIDYCPNCHAENSPTVEEIQGVYYEPKKMKIMNPQPLGGESVMPYNYKGFPVRGIYLDAMDSKMDYKILLPLPMSETLMPIPIEPTISTTSNGGECCPNDIGMRIVGQQQIEGAKKQIDDAQAKLIGAMKLAYGIGPADCQTNEGFTYLVAEGRSRKANIGRNGKWIDESPECISYRSKEGITLPTPRTYPRWNHIPRYADPASTHNSYLGPNPSTHIVMDWHKSSKSVAAFISAPHTFHTVVEIAKMNDVDVGQSTLVYECLTCKGAVDKGGMLEYRISKGKANIDGTTRGSFPQEVLDAELKYQSEFPLKNDAGKDVVVAWGVTTGSQNGKEMLKNPAKKIRID